MGNCARPFPVMEITPPTKRAYRKGIYRQIGKHGKTLNIRVSSAFHQSIKDAAHKQGVPIATLIRECMIQIAEKINEQAG